MTTPVEAYPATARTTGLRLRDRLAYDAPTVHRILDEAYHCTLGFVVDDEPRLLPTLHVRIDDTLYVHGSAGSGPMLGVRLEGHPELPVCISVTLLDGLVLARSQFHHSANYRSVVAHGAARLVTDDGERRRVLAALVDKVVPGRAADSRAPNARELAATAVLALPLREVSAKVRVGEVGDEPADYALAHWAGVVPVHTVLGRPEPDPGLTVAVPEYLRPVESPWLTPVTLRGHHVSLEPLDVSHVDGLFAATDDAEVWRWLPRRQPTNRDEMATIVTEALREHETGQRVPFVIRDAGTGTVIGSTSYYSLDAANRALAIGYTIVGRPWWRTAVNTESKLLLMARAFETLDAVRVEWHTDLHNENSQRAIVRLGAVREGILRAHRRRPDGSWRDTVLYSMTAAEWPAARNRLTARLEMARSEMARSERG